MENGKQVWPITRADCIYNVAGDELLSNVVDKIAQDLLDEVARAKEEEERLAGLIADMKDAEKEGSLAHKIAANDAAIKAEVQDRKDAVQEVQEQLDALVGEGQGSVKDQIDAAKQEMQEAVEDVQDELDAFKEEQGQKNEALVAKDGELAQAIADNKAAQDEVNEDFEGRIADVEEFVAGHDHKPITDRIAALEELHKEGGVVEEAIKAVKDQLDDFIADQADIDAEQDEAIQAAQDAADQAQADVDALEEAVGHKSFVDENGETVAATGLMQEMAQNAAQIAAEKSRAEGQEAAIRQELADEKAALQAEIDADVKVEADRAKGEEAAIRGEFAAADAALKAELQKEIDDDVKVEADRAVAEEAKIRQEFAAADSALGQKIDKEIEDRKDAINELVNGDIAELKAFKDNHSHEQMEADIDQLQKDVDAIEKEIGVKAGDGAATGIYLYVDEKVAAQNNDMNQAVQDLSGLVTAEENARKNADALLQQAINAVQADVDANETACANALAAEKVLREAAEKKLGDDLAKEISDRDAAVKAEAKSREDGDKALDERLKTVEEMVGLESGADGESLSDRVAANEAKLAGLEKDTVQASIDKAEADAKAHAEQKIADLIDSAPEAMDTLRELAEAIKDNKDVYDGYVAEHATAMATMKTELQAEIDADVAAEAAVRVAEEAKIIKELSDAIAQEVKDRDAAIKVEADRALAAEQAIQEQINKGLKTKAYDGDTEYEDLTPLA